MKKIIFILLIVSTSIQGLARLIAHQQSVDGNFPPEAMRLAIIGDTYDRIRNPLWHLFLLFRPRNVGITTDTVPEETDSNRSICVGHTCPSSDEQAQLRLRTRAFRQNLVLLRQVRY
jgi:hypothetical protein